MELAVPVESLNGVPIYYDVAGDGEPVVLVHGAWTESRTWGFVTPALSASFRVVAYDRRGHGRSESDPESGTVHDDVGDLAALIEHLGLAANLVANSYGACIALRLAVERSELVRRTAAHEPPFLPLLADDPESKRILDATALSVTRVRERIEAGDYAGGAEQFVDEVALGPGMWRQLPPEMQQMFVRHAPTFLGELNDPDALSIDLDTLAGVSVPVLFSQGDQSPPMFSPIIRRLADAAPHARLHTFSGAGHVPHLTHPEQYVHVINDFLLST
jgi:pimeloyl-ACP methyl ester carboxylesterase